MLFRSLPERPAIHAAVEHFEYAPWMVANLTLRSFPKERVDVPLAWDNVIYNSAALGYVVATHQNLDAHPLRTVLTYYHALADSPPPDARRRLLQSDWQNWVDAVFTDLSAPHPEIRDITEQLDVMRWGHAMIRPRPGFLWGEARTSLTRPQGRIHFAHSDLSGFSLFEEAQYRGVVAAERVLEEIGKA